MCTVIRQRDLSSDDLASLSCRRSVDHEPDEGAVQRSLAIHEPQPGDCFGFGPVTISQLVRPVDPRDVPGWT